VQLDKHLRGVVSYLSPLQAPRAPRSEATIITLVVRKVESPPVGWRISWDSLDPDLKPTQAIYRESYETYSSNLSCLRAVSRFSCSSPYQASTTLPSRSMMYVIGTALAPPSVSYCDIALLASSEVSTMFGNVT
jgi:hypothetical protein